MVDGGATRAPGLEIWGESLRRTQVVIPYIVDVSYLITLLKALLGYVYLMVESGDDGA